jgi:O-antigen/teichoic acid export membrane protein
MSDADKNAKTGKNAGKKRHNHPGGTGAALGVQVARFTGWQGGSLLISNILHYASIAVVAAMLGPKPLGAYALLFFLTGVVSQVIHVISKPGTMMRTFGASDDEDDMEEEEEGKNEMADEGVSDKPAFTLGVGMVWTIFLAVLSVAIVYVFRTSIAQFLLGDPGQADAVVFATITGSVWAISRLGEMVIWFEGRPLTYVLIDAARPAFNLIAIIVIVSGGAGVKGAIIGQTIGTSTATLICVLCLLGSFEWAFSFKELWQILKRGSIRIPIASAMWVVQNTDTFLLSRFVDHSQIGLYNMASRTGFMVQFLPQGFRMALRPLRKTAVYTAYKEEYGTAVAKGQLLAYFLLISITAVLAMLLGGELLIHIAGNKFQSAAPIIPLTAAAMTMPALFRSIGQMSSYPKKRVTFVSSCCFIAAAYIAFLVFLAPRIGIYGAPLALIIAFMIPITFMFLRSQLGQKPMDFPYIAILKAGVIAAAIATGFHLLHPRNHVLQLICIVVLMCVWFALLPLLRIVPEAHWRPILHIFRSFFRGAAMRFDTEPGLAALNPADREALRAAVIDRLPAQTLVPLAAGGGNGGGDGAGDGDGAVDGDGEGPVHDQDDVCEGARLVRLLRQIGDQGGVPIAERNDLDAGISLYLFADEPVAVRLAKMRSLIFQGVDAHELRTLEDVRDGLAKAPASAWGIKRGRNGLRRGGQRPSVKRA